jgi:hypothetical protein
MSGRSGKPRRSRSRRGSDRLSRSSTAGSPRWPPAVPVRRASSVPRCPGSRRRSRGRRARHVRPGRRDRNRVGGAPVPVRASGDPQVAALVIHASSCSHRPSIGRSRPAIPGFQGELCRNARGRPRASGTPTLGCRAPPAPGRPLGARHPDPPVSGPPVGEATPGSGMDAGGCPQAPATAPRGQEGWVLGPRWGRRAPEPSQAAPWRRSVASWRLLR